MAKKNTTTTKEVEGVSTDAPVKTSAKKTAKNKVNTTFAVIMGIGNLAVIASIAYSAAVIVLDTEGITPLILISPMVIFAIIKLVKQFIK